MRPSKALVVVTLLATSIGGVPAAIGTTGSPSPTATHHGSASASPTATHHGNASASPTVHCPWFNFKTSRPDPIPRAGVNWPGCDLKAFDLSGYNMTHANLAGANLERANLLNLNLTGANLSSANLAHARMGATTIKVDANFTGARCPNVKFHGSGGDC